MTGRSLGGALIALLLALAVPAGAQEGLEDRVREVAAGLRCPVCQNLSVADSQSELAQEMRGLIREQLQAGKTPEEIRAYFLEKYGDWILLSPRARGLGLLVWIGPFAAAAGGLVAAGLLVRRWARRPRRAPPAADPALLEQVRREALEEDLAVADDEAPGPPLEAERARLYAALRELDFDHRAGKLSDEDHAEMRQAYEARAAAVLAALKADPARPARPPRGRPAAARPAARPWRAAAAAVFLLAFGVAIGAFLATSLRPRPDSTTSITGDLLTGTGAGGMGAGGRAAMAAGGEEAAGDAASMPGPVMAQAREYRARLEKDPRDLPALLGMAWLSFQRQDLKQAVEYYRRALDVDPDNAEALTHFGVILSQAGHLDPALAAFDRVLARNPKERLALWGKGWTLYQGKQDYMGAIQAWERLLTTDLADEDRDRVAGLLVEARKRLAASAGR